jgi:hypothetical protein
MLDYNDSKYNSGKKVIIEDDTITEFMHKKGSIDISIVRYIILDNGTLGIDHMHKLSCIDEKDAFNEFCKIRRCDYGTTVNYYLWELFNNKSIILSSRYPTTTACFMLEGILNEVKKVAIKKFMEMNNLEFKPDQLH